MEWQRVMTEDVENVVRISLLLLRVVVRMIFKMRFVLRVELMTMIKKLFLLRVELILEVII